MTRKTGPAPGETRQSTTQDENPAVADSILATPIAQIAHSAATTVAPVTVLAAAAGAVEALSDFAALLRETGRSLHETVAAGLTPRAEAKGNVSRNLGMQGTSTGRRKGHEARRLEMSRGSRIVRPNVSAGLAAPDVAAPEIGAAAAATVAGTTTVAAIVTVTAATGMPGRMTGPATLMKATADVPAATTATAAAAASATATVAAVAVMLTSARTGAPSAAAALPPAAAPVRTGTATLAPARPALSHLATPRPAPAAQPLAPARLSVSARCQRCPAVVACTSRRSGSSR